jgi:hypothetical protein
MPRRRTAKPVQIGPGLIAFDRWSHEIDDDAFVVRVQLAVEDGKTVVDAVTVERKDDGGPEVTGAVLRRVPVARIAQSATPWAMKRAAKGRFVPVSEPEDWDQVVRSLRRPRTPSPRTVGPEDLRRVAEAVHKAQTHHRPTSGAVAEVMVISNQYARRLIKRARDEQDPDTGKPYLDRPKPKSNQKGTKK